MQILNAENRDWKELFLANKIPIIASTLLIAAGVTSAAVSNSIADGDKIVAGVNFEGFPLSGMNTTAATFRIKPQKKFSLLLFNMEKKILQLILLTSAGCLKLIRQLQRRKVTGAAVLFSKI